jgi:death-on-curing protein
MNDRVWITEVDCLALHDELLVRHGGRSGIRDQDALLSCVHRPQMMEAVGCPSLFDLAASYITSFAEERPFRHGNLMTGMLVTMLFIELNGYRFRASEPNIVIQTLALAAGELNETARADLLSKASLPDLADPSP